MQLRQYPLVFLATTLLLGLTEQVSAAFTFTFQPSGFYRPLVNYRLSDGSTGTVQTSVPLIIERGGTTEFQNKLKATFPSWIFNSADKDLAGRFDIRAYYADVLSNPPGVGANILLHYSPAVTYNPLINYNPTTAGSELHWIQRVMSNHNFKTNQHGDTEDVIDVASGQPNPFYDLIPGVTLTDEDDFADGPARPDLQNDHYWSAELYLVEKTPGKQEVTIYNGISWGWRNIVTPPPPVSLPPCVGGSGGGGCLTTASTNQNLLFFNNSNAGQFRQPVDEPTTGLGLLALGAWGAIAGVKIWKSKQQ